MSLDGHQQEGHCGHESKHNQKHAGDDGTGHGEAHVVLVLDTCPFLELGFSQVFDGRKDKE